MWADNFIKQLKLGKTIEIKPKGNSMTPKIKSGQTVVISPDIDNLKKNDIVLCKVKRNIYLHKIIQIAESGKILIGNNHGNINGWTSIVYGKVIEIKNV